MSTVATGAVVGASFAGGCWMLVRSFARTRLRLVDRLSPYLDEDRRPDRVASGASLSQLVGRPLQRLGRALDRAAGGSVSVRHRLELAGRDIDVEVFRMEQVAWAGGGLLVSMLLVASVAARGARVSPLGGLLLGSVLAVAGAVSRDRLLSAEAARRQQRMLAQLPTVAEMLALSIGAGEGVTSALERVSRIVRGELSTELRRTLADARAGVPLVDALSGLASRTSLPAVARFVDGMAVAVDRGTPLAEVLRAQAGDVRDERRRALLETAGRREIAMLFPVVFLVLPVTVVFALFPGFASLSLAVP
jgi:tight adherence protein C